MAAPLPGKLLDRRYLVIRPLAGGGFGETHVAEDTRLPGNPRCVVKRLKPASGDPHLLKNAKRLFLTEAETLQRLGKHDQIPQLLAHFEEDQEFYLVQEFIDGQTLTQELRSGYQWSERRVCQLLKEVLQILEFIHSNGVIHRDVKPDNIIRRRTDGKLVLVDFGAVKQVRTQIALQAQVSATIATGTPGYMPTEQSHGKPRPNSDIYALGIIGIQAVTGLHPTQLQEDMDTGEIIWQDWAQCSDTLTAILTRMVRYHFKDRYQSATDALIDLERLATPLISSLEISPAVLPDPDAIGQPVQPSVNSRPTVVFTESVLDVDPTALSSIPTEDAPPLKSLVQSPPSVVMPLDPILEPNAATQLSEPSPTSFFPERSEKSLSEPDVRPDVQPDVLSEVPSDGPVAVLSPFPASFPSVPDTLIPPPVNPNLPDAAQAPSENGVSALELPPRSSVRVGAMFKRLPQFQIAAGVGVMLVGLAAGYAYFIHHQDYLTAERALEQVEDLKAAREYDQCVQQAETMLNAYAVLETETQTVLGECLLARATQLAEKSQYKDAIAQASKITPAMTTYARAQQQMEQWSNSIFEVAQGKYEQGLFDEAMAIADAIPANSPVAEKARVERQRWQTEWEKNQSLLGTAKQALDNGRWQEAIDTARQVRLLQQPIPSTNPYWRNEVQPLIARAEQQLAAAEAAATRAAAARAISSSHTPSRASVPATGSRSTMPRPAVRSRSAPTRTRGGWTEERR